MSDGGQAPDEPLVFGVPGGRLVDALRSAGLAEADIIALLGRGIARSAGIAAASADGGFHFQTQIAETAPECTLTYQRVFTHPDFLDGVTVVQAGSTPEEI